MRPLPHRQAHHTHLSPIRSNLQQTPERQLRDCQSEDELIMFDNELFRVKSADLPIPVLPAFTLKPQQSWSYLSIPYHLRREDFNRNAFQAAIVALIGWVVVAWSASHWQAVQMLVGYAVVVAVAAPWIRRAVRRLRRWRPAFQ